MEVETCGSHSQVGGWPGWGGCLIAQNGKAVDTCVERTFMGAKNM